MTNIAIINPNAGKNNYSGPNVFMERLFSNNKDISATVVTGQEDAAAALPWAKVEVPTAYTPPRRMAQLRWMAALTLWLWRNAGRYDVIHAHGIYLFNLLPLLAAELRRVPVVLLPLGENAELGFVHDRHWRPLAALRRSIVSRAALGLGLSRKTQQELITAGMPRDRVGPIGNPVDTEAFRPSHEDDRFARRTVGFVGTIGHNKGAHVVLEAISIVRSRAGLEDVRGLFVGPYSNESFRTSFSGLVEDLGLIECVEMTGYTNAVAEHVQQMSLFILPSTQEGLPGALVETMSAGLPAVVTDIGAMGDVVRSADAGQVTDRDASALADAIAAILQDGDNWQSLSRNASEHVSRHYSIAAVQRDYQRALESIITSGGQQ